MSANPDLADIVTTYIKDLWPLVDARKVPANGWDDTFAIEVNGHTIGVTYSGVLATWNFVAKCSDYVEPTDPNFFSFIRHWAKVKAGLDEPKTSSV